MNSFNKNRVICFIPARYASTRLPGKMLLRIKGRPLVMWVYNRAVESGAFDDVLVATDDKRIHDAVKNFGGKSVITSRKHKSGTDRIFEAVQNIKCKYIVNLQGDEPLIPVRVLKDFSKHLRELKGMSLLTCVAKASENDMHNPDVVKVVLSVNGDALYFSRAPIPYFRNKTQNKAYRHYGIYGFTKESLERFCSLPPGRLEKTESLEQLRALENGMRIHCIVRNYNSISIDTKEDLDKFKASVGDS